MLYHALKVSAFVLGLQVATLGMAAKPVALRSRHDGCVLQYQRADNMWAAAGRPDGNLGTETISLAPGATVWFDTDWKYEKLRNDGTHYYGSHLRIATNSGGRQIVLRIRTPTWFGEVSLQPGQSQQFQHDVTTVRCP
jgi:hypothetical protein